MGMMGPRRSQPAFSRPAVLLRTSLQTLCPAVVKPGFGGCGADQALDGPFPPPQSGLAHEDIKIDSSMGGMIHSWLIPAEDAPLVLDFITEAGEHLETAESTLLELENQPDDTELINKVFRSFHTIKGMAGFLNLTEIGSLAHSSENLLDLARKGQLVLAGDATDVVFESIDALKKMLAGLQDSVQAGAPVAALETLAVLLEKIQAVAEGTGRPQPSQPALDPEDDRKLDAVLADKTTGPTSKASGGSTAHASVAKWWCRASQRSLPSGSSTAQQKLSAP